jgi:CubicO group peptidase (beta-lactamase class C family)
MFKKFIALLIAFIALTSTAFAADPGATFDVIAANHGVKAYSISVFEGDEIIYSHSNGQSRYGTPATSSTKYRIASVSKMVSGMLTMMQIDNGSLSLDDKLSAVINPAFNNGAAVGNLLSHTAGIIDNGAYNSAISGTPFPSLDYVLSMGGGANGSVGSFNYSNYNMGLAGAVIENATGSYFVDYANTALFDKMGIDAGYMTDKLDDKSTVASMGNTDPLAWGNMRGAYNTIPLGQMYLLAQGELYITADDLAKVSMILAGDGTYNGYRYLSEDSVAAMNSIQANYADTSMSYGLATQSTESIIPGTRLFGHQGNAYGVISCVFFDPESNQGVVFLTNGASAAKLSSGVYSVNNDIVKAAWELF